MYISLELSNLENKKNRDIKKDNKKVSSRIFGYLKKTYFKYTFIGFPYSVTNSNNLAACVIQIKIERDNEINKKILKNSTKKYL